MDISAVGGGVEDEKKLASHRVAARSVEIVTECGVARDASATRHGNAS